MDLDKFLRDAALLAARLTLGGTMAVHGAQKLLGVQDGPGLEGTAKMMDSLGFRPGERYAPLVAAGELTSGALISLGALGPVGPAMLLSIMLVAIETVHRPKGYLNQKGGFEMNAMYVMLALLLANETYGSFSLDQLFGLRERMRPMHGWIALVAGAAAATIVLQQREPSRAEQQESGTSQDSTHSNSTVGASV